MIRNKWNKVLGKRGMSQVALSRQITATQPMLSAAANGSGVLPLKEFEAACVVLGCAPTDIYEMDVLSALYEEYRERPHGAEKPARVRADNRVRIDADVWARVQECASATGIPAPVLVQTFVTDGLLRSMVSDAGEVGGGS